MTFYICYLLVQWILPEPHGTPEGDVGLLGVENFRSVLDPETCLKSSDWIYVAPKQRIFCAFVYRWRDWLFYTIKTSTGFPFATGFNYFCRRVYMRRENHFEHARFELGPPIEK